MIQIDLPMPKECELTYEIIERNDTGVVSENKYMCSCPCYDSELMECKAVVPNRKLYDPFKGVDELHENHRPNWCPLVDVNPVKRRIAGKNRLGHMNYLCGWCEANIVPSDNYCRECGRKVKW